MGYANTDLWLRSMVCQSTDQAKALDHLSGVYSRFWQNAAQLSSQIGRDLPELTLHDETHFDALWERASTIAGDKLTLSPLECFVFGGSMACANIFLNRALVPVEDVAGRLKASGSIYCTLRLHEENDGVRADLTQLLKFPEGDIGGVYFEDRELSFINDVIETYQGDGTDEYYQLPSNSRFDMNSMFGCNACQFRRARRRAGLFVPAAVANVSL
jgi:hypothetical protein